MSQSNRFPIALERPALQTLRHQYLAQGEGLPRQPQLEIAGLPHRVAQRGIDRQAFVRPPMLHDASALLSAYARYLNVSVQGWCLMTKHVHLLLTPHATATSAA